MCEAYKLEAEKNYRFLRLPEENTSDGRVMTTKRNVEKFNAISTIMEDLQFTEHQISTIYSIISAILNLGELKFQENDNDLSAVLGNREILTNVVELLEVDFRKMSWAFTNYCLVRNGNVIRKKNSCDEARDTQNVFANTLYARLVDYVVNEVNIKLDIGKQIL